MLRAAGSGFVEFGGLFTLERTPPGGGVFDADRERGKELDKNGVDDRDSRTYGAGGGEFGIRSQGPNPPGP